MDQNLTRIIGEWRSMSVFTRLLIVLAVIWDTAGEGQKVIIVSMIYGLIAFVLVLAHASPAIAVYLP